MQDFILINIQRIEIINALKNLKHLSMLLVVRLNKISNFFNTYEIKIKNKKKNFNKLKVKKKNQPKYEVLKKMA